MSGNPDLEEVHATNLERMYRAGYHEIPTQARRLAHAAASMRDAMTTFDAQAAKAGDPQVLRSVLHVADTLYEVAARHAASLPFCARSVVATADFFRETDAHAKRDFGRLNDGLRNGSVPRLPTVPDLPATEPAGSDDVDTTPAPPDERQGGTPSPGTPGTATTAGMA